MTEQNGNGNGNYRYTAQQVIEALEAKKGMVYLAAKMLRCSHTTVYNYMKRYATVRRAKECEDGKFGDMCELKLYDAAQKGESWAVQFALRTKFKSRGYVERQEVSGPDGEKLEPLVIIRDNGSSTSSDSG